MKVKASTSQFILPTRRLVLDFEDTTRAKLGHRRHYPALRFGTRVFCNRSTGTWRRCHLQTRKEVDRVSRLRRHHSAQSSNLRCPHTLLESGEGKGLTKLGKDRFRAALAVRNRNYSVMWVRSLGRSARPPCQELGAEL